jgi:hypothetical protein
MINATTWKGLERCNGTPSEVQHVVSGACRVDDDGLYTVWDCVQCTSGRPLAKGCLEQYKYSDDKCTQLVDTAPEPNPVLVPANDCEEQGPLKHFRIDCAVP